MRKISLLILAILFTHISSKKKINPVTGSEHSSSEEEIDIERG